MADIRMNEASNKEVIIMTIVPQDIDRIGRCVFNVYFHTFYAVYANLFNHTNVGYVKEKCRRTPHNTYVAIARSLVQYWSHMRMQHSSTMSEQETPWMQS